MAADRVDGRRAGLLVPVFSVPSRASWGIGEIADLPALGRWMVESGFRIVQLLPLNEMAGGQNSPYSALSAMAIDPVYIAPAHVPEVRALGGESFLSTAERAQLRAARESRRIEYALVRPIKNRVLRAAFDRFCATDWRGQTARAAALNAYIERERWWLDDYALFRAIHARAADRHWREWDPPLRDRDPGALEEARQELAAATLYYAYLQWLADEQWNAARSSCGVAIFGDFPFMVSGDSADVWARQEDFRLDASVGAPPDAFSEKGQDWGFPAYRWKEIEKGGYEWLAARARRSSELYDGYRVDHLVGFFRTYVREADGSAQFVPAEENAQISQGERLLRLFGAVGATVTAEDLGVIPEFVRSTLERLGIPGYKVLRWEREWHVEGQPFRDPAAYPPRSVATTGTHDTETLAEWWDLADEAERAAVVRIPRLRAAGCNPRAPFSEAIRDAILEVLFASGSDTVLLPIHDVFGWRDRINTPALISNDNWTWRLPWPVEELMTQPLARERGAFTRRLAARHRR